MCIRHYDFFLNIILLRLFSNIESVNFFFLRNKLNKYLYNFFSKRPELIYCTVQLINIEYPICLKHYLSSIYIILRIHLNKQKVKS